MVKVKAVKDAVDGTMLNNIGKSKAYDKRRTFIDPRHLSFGDVYICKTSQQVILLGQQDFSQCL